METNKLYYIMFSLMIFKRYNYLFTMFILLYLDLKSIIESFIKYQIQRIIL